MENDEDKDYINLSDIDQVEALDVSGDAARRERVQRLRQQAEALSGGPLLGSGIDRLPLEIAESVWQQIIAYETAEPVSLFDRLVAGGVTLPPPVLVHEGRISEILWETIYFLSTLGCYLENTDHLGDRELYTILWDNLLREPAILFPDDPNYAYHLDIIGSGSFEDQQLYLTYYASDEDRSLWAVEWPEDPLPKAAPRPYDRDRLLPKPYSSLAGNEQIM